MLTLRPEEYSTNHVGTACETIEIDRAALERLRDHYQKIYETKLMHGESPQVWFNAGRADMLKELLQLFEN